MAKTLSVTIGADTSKFVNGVKEAKDALDNFLKKSEEAAKISSDNASVTEEQVSAYKNVISELDNVANSTMSAANQQKILTEQLKSLKDQWDALSNDAKSSDFGKAMSDTISLTANQIESLKGKMSSIDSVPVTQNVRNQLRLTTKQFQELVYKYNEMDAAEKASAQGQELARKLDELRSKAGYLKDVIDDANAEIRVMASDHPNLDAFNDMIGVGGGVVSTYSSLIAKLTGDEKSLKNAIATVMTVQTFANTTTKIANALDKSSNLMLKTKRIQEGALAVGIRIRTAAENKGVVATKAATAAQKLFNVVASMNPYILLATAITAVGAALIGFSRNAEDAADKESKLQSESEKTKNSMEEQQKTLAKDTADLTASYNILQMQWNNLKSDAERTAWIDRNQSAFANLGLSITDAADAENYFVKESKKTVDALRDIAAAKSQQTFYKQSNEEVEKWMQQHPDDNPKLVYDMDLKQLEEAEEKAKEAQAVLDGLGKPKQVNIKVNGEAVEGSLTDLENRLSELNKKYKDGTLNISAGDYKKQVDELENKIKNKKIRMGLEFELDPQSLTAMEAELSKFKKDYADGKLTLSTDEYKTELAKLEDDIRKKKIRMGLEPYIDPESIQWINDRISKLQSELNMAVSDDSRREIQNQIDELTGKKEAIELKLKPVVTEDDIKDIMSEFDDFATVRIQKQGMSPTNKVDNAVNNAENLKEELELNQSILKTYERQYSLIVRKLEAGGKLNANEEDLAKIYENAAAKVNDLAKAYDNAAESARELQRASMLKEKQLETFKSGIGIAASFSSTIRGVHDTVKDLEENWEEMDGVEKFTTALDLCINGINTAISAYESINEIITLFGEISELVSAKKVAADTAQTVSDTIMTTTDQANTQKRIQQDQAEAGSTAEALPVFAASSVVKATESGSGMPFPLNIVAIALGVAAVIAALAMMDSFKDGGIVPKAANGLISSGSYSGDRNLVRVNGAEMILNGTQQKRLFRMLNQSGAFGGGSNGIGQVEFKLKGTELIGCIKNSQKKKSNL